MTDKLEAAKSALAYEEWFYMARNPKTDMPYATHLIYRICDKNDQKFHEAEEIMQAAFEAGYNAALLAAEPAPVPAANPPRSPDWKRINALNANGYLQAKDEEEQQRLAVYIRRKYGTGSAAKRTVDGELRVYRREIDPLAGTPDGVVG